MRKVRIIMEQPGAIVYTEHHHVGYVVHEDDVSLTIRDGSGTLTVIKGHFEIVEEE